jgi:hypothetical protein
MLILIPTLDLDLALRCARSFVGQLDPVKGIIIIFNGREHLASRQLSDQIFVVGSDATDGVVAALSSFTTHNIELLFGDRIYGRSYGGSSNLISVFANVLGSPHFLKIDDDFILDDSNEIRFPTLTDQNVIYFGKESEGDSGALHTLPSELSSELSRFVYTRAQYKERMGTEFSGATKKNGILYGKAEILRVAHYPVLYCREVNVHARGEVYWFLRQLEAHGGALIYAPTLNLKHSPLSQRPLEAWLRATVLGTVLWWTFRSDEILQREELYRRFEELKTWLLGNNTASRSFLDCNDPILDFELVKTFSDHVVGASFQRALMWDEIFSNDLARVMEAELPFFQAIRTLIGSR